MSRTEGGRIARKQGVVDGPAPHRSSKDTKRWCLGKVGREHEPEWTESRHERVYQNLKRTRPRWLDYRCVRCKKDLDHCWPWGFYHSSRQGPCPRCGGKHKVPVPDGK